MATQEALKRAQKKYDENTTVQVKMKLNVKTDRDILEKLESVENDYLIANHIIIIKYLIVSSK